MSYEFDKIFHNLYSFKVKQLVVGLPYIELVFPYFGAPFNIFCRYFAHFC